MHGRSVLLWPAVVMALAASLGAAAQVAQVSPPTAPPSRATVGFMHAIHATNNVETIRRA